MRTEWRVERRAGFTLVELVVVMVIAVVLLGLTVPNFVKITARHQFESAARRMVADIRETRERVKTENTSYEILFLAAADRYNIKRYDNLSVTVRQRVQLPAQVDLVYAAFGGSGNVLRFNAYGEPNWNGTVTLKNRLTGEMCYVIVSQTGRVRVSNVPAAD
ncbi:MAG: prepilin-type N-terminal cleavage/methylation domain-containing protein [Bacillota bacterium]